MIFFNSLALASACSSSSLASPASCASLMRAFRAACRLSISENSTPAIGADVISVSRCRNSSSLAAAAAAAAAAASSAAFASASASSASPSASLLPFFSFFSFLSFFSFFSFFALASESSSPAPLSSSSSGAAQACPAAPRLGISSSLSAVPVMTVDGEAEGDAVALELMAPPLPPSQKTSTSASSSEVAPSCTSALMKADATSELPDSLLMREAGKNVCLDFRA
mmetsp:Transcript_66819/g.145201  ORF Transcript_66819/g.145201 Transcript_66819/m.145201 type:complete len:225 (-) Transcript_66819:677-1351(-)